MAIDSIELSRVREHAAGVVRAAASRGYELPPEYAEARALVDAAEVLQREPAPIPPTLPKPKDLPVWAAKVAASRRDWEGRVKVAAEIRDRCELDAIRVAHQAAPALADRLADDVNAELLPAFAELIATAPRTLTGYEDDAQVDAHQRLNRTLITLRQAVLDRGQLALATGEADDLGRTGLFFLITDPAPTALSSDVHAAIKSVEGNVPSTVDEWAALSRIGLSLAHVGEAQRRLRRFNDATANAIRTPDGGMIDRTIGQLEALSA